MTLKSFREVTTRLHIVGSAHVPKTLKGFFHEKGQIKKSELFLPLLISGLVLIL